MSKRKKIKVIERKLGRERAWGLSYKGDNLIEIDSRLKGKKKLLIIVHELLHQALMDENNEKEIHRVAIIISNGLWGQNYRRVDQ